MMILDIGRLEEGKISLNLTQQSVHQALVEVHEAFTWMAGNYEVNLAVGACDAQYNFSLDWALIQRVLANLVSNAIKHSPPQTTVTLSCDYIEATSDNPATLRLSVSDEGEGIPEQDQNRIFDKFTQASQRTKGSRMDTGLGLTFWQVSN